MGYQASVTAEFDGNFPRANFTGLAASTWYYLATTYDGTAIRAYVDGALASTTAQTGAPASETASGTIAQYFLGTLNEVRLAGSSHSTDWRAAQNASLRDDGYVTYAPPQSSP